MPLNQNSLRLYWMTDIHLVDELSGQPSAPGAIWMERHYYAALDKLHQAVDIINDERPDYVICTGDVIDRAQSLDSFMKEWERIEPPKAFVIGNHDLEIGGETFEKQFGIRDHPLTAGSRFNRSIALGKGNVKVRALVLDTYVGEDGQRLYDTCEGIITEEAFQWLEREILYNPESLILLFSHNGLGGPEEYFDPTSVARFAKLAALAWERGKTILHLAGHHHVHPMVKVKEMQPGFTFINGVAMICEETSSINVIEIDQDGSYRIDYRSVGYVKAL